MQTLSRALVDLYDLAEDVPVQDYPRRLLEVLKCLVPFDGAMLGAGDTGVSSDGAEPQRVSACRALRPNAVEQWDPTACASCRHDGDVPACGRLQQKNPGQQERELMLHVPARTSNEHAFWLALCRCNGQRFGNGDRRRLRTVWPHVLRGIAINRRRFLDRMLRRTDEGTGALINARGGIEIAEPGFTALLSVEWPRHTGAGLPVAALESMHTESPYLGKKMKLSFRRQDGCLLCIAQRYDDLAGLTKTEGMVAQYFASGLNYREVAQTLGVSENTVRTHLKQAYSKLGVHDKAQLANRLGRH